MTKTVNAIWNFDLEAGKDKGILLLAGFNSDGSKGIGYGYWDNIEGAWESAETNEPMPNFTPKAWLHDATIIPEM